MADIRILRVLNGWMLEVNSEPRCASPTYVAETQESLLKIVADLTEADARKPVPKTPDARQKGGA